MLTLDATALARIAAGVRGVAWLVVLEFTSGTIRYTTAPQTLLISGDSYTGLGALATVSALNESENTDAAKITLGFSVVSTAMLGATLGNVETYRGQPAHLYLQLFDEAFQPAGDPVLRWSGTMDRVTVNRTPSDKAGGPSLGTLDLECSRYGMARARNAPGLRLNHAQQQMAYPGDLGLEYVSKLIEQPALWLTKAFQRI
jgi:hypothetical protein